ncbi:hypothetical protein L208DRAFT_1282728, partial [Tricholoma matsutake]
YLGTDPEHVTNALAWWYEHKHVYPHLHWMVLDYFLIPGMFSNPNARKFLDHQFILATSVDLSVQLMQALLCLGIWSEMGYVRDMDMKAATVLPEVGLDEDNDDLCDNWDAI